jgi:hypothetical protein
MPFADVKDHNKGVFANVTYPITVGAKNRFFNNRPQLNGSAYWYDYKNVQVMVSGTSTRAGVNESQLTDPNGKPVDVDGNGIAGENKMVYENPSVGLGIPGQVQDPWDQFQMGAYRTLGPMSPWTG